MLVHFLLLSFSMYIILIILSLFGLKWIKLLCSIFRSLLIIVLYISFAINFLSFHSFSLFEIWLLIIKNFMNHFNLFLSLRFDLLSWRIPWIISILSWRSILHTMLLNYGGFCLQQHGMMTGAYACEWKRGVSH